MRGNLMGGLMQRVTRETSRAGVPEEKRAARSACPRPIGRCAIRRRAKQGELDFRSWGGARKGAGRKPKGERALVPHVARPAHKARFPVLITTRVRPGLPSLRRSGEAARIREAFARTNLVRAAR